MFVGRNHKVIKVETVGVSSCSSHFLFPLLTRLHCVITFAHCLLRATKRKKSERNSRVPPCLAVSIFCSVLSVVAVMCNRHRDRSIDHYHKSVTILAAHSSEKKSKSRNMFWSVVETGRASFGGVRTGRSEVNSSSKLVTSSRFFCFVKITYLVYRNSNQQIKTHTTVGTNGGRIFFFNKFSKFIV